MKHIQMEGTWGGSVDVAAEFRAACAMGLANSRDPRKMEAMVELLADAEGPARAGAARAIAVVGSEAASMLLRYKALIGDAEPEGGADRAGTSASSTGGVWTRTARRLGGTRGNTVSMSPGTSSRWAMACR